MTLALAAENGNRIPADTDIESSLIGSMLLYEQAIVEAVEIVEPSDFYLAHHQIIVQAIYSLSTKGQRVDYQLVKHEIERTGQNVSESLFPPLLANAASKSSARDYAQLVKDRATQRRLIQVGIEIQQLGYDGAENEQALLENAEAVLFAARRSNDSSLVSMSTGINDWLSELEQRSERDGPEIPTGLVDLDDKVNGLHRSQLMIMAARPAMGKTSLAGQLAVNVARSGLPVLFVSIEMSHEELLTRFVAQESRLVGSELNRGALGTVQWQKIVEAVSKLQEAPIEIYDASAPTPLDIRSNARKVISRHGSLGLIVVDYLQLLFSRERQENRQVEVAKFSRELKRLSKSLNVPILALSQLNRNLEIRQDKRPMLSDLRESGAIEADADVVMFVYRDEYYNEDSSDKGIAELIVSKNRHGPTGTVKVAANMASGRWMDLRKEQF